MTERTFYLIRHGQTDWNVVYRWQGHTDIPLNDIGREQARRLGQHLLNVPIDRAISSDSTRAYETAQLALGGRDLPITTDPAWREFHAGILEGKTWTEIQAEHADCVTGMNTDFYGYVFPGGESRGAMQTRALAAFQKLLDDGQGENILIVSHGMTIRTVLAGLFPDTIKHPMTDISRVENTSLSIIRQTPDGISLVQMPDASHLEDEAAAAD
jgi:broad specificity phosphatase PhoE